MLWIETVGEGRIILIGNLPVNERPGCLESPKGVGAPVHEQAEARVTKPAQVIRHNYFNAPTFFSCWVANCSDVF